MISNNSVFCAQDRVRTIRLEATWRCEIHQESAAEIQVNNFYPFLPLLGLSVNILGSSGNVIPISYENRRYSGSF